jgi:hypothetical protein
MVAPSISSTFFSLFLNPSMDRKSEWTEGVLSLASPFALYLCFAPIAACSCFSTPSILVVSFRMSDTSSLVGCVAGSLSWSTMISTSSSLFSNAFCVFVICRNYSAVAGSVVGFDLVFLLVFASSKLALSSNAAILPTKSSITSLRWLFLSSASL